MNIKESMFLLAIFIAPSAYSAGSDYCLHGGFVDPNNPPTCNNSDLNNAVNDLSSDITTESTARQSGDASTLSSANTYTDGKVDTESTARQSGDASTLSSANTYTDGKIDTESAARQSGDASTLSSANTYTNQTISNFWQKSEGDFKALNSRIDRLNNKLNAAIASSVAISSIPYVAEDTFSLGVGAGNYSNGNAVAVGIQYKTTMNSNVRTNFSWDSTGQLVSGAGFSLGW